MTGWPKCGCGRRFPSETHLQMHRWRDACLEEREHVVFIRRLQVEDRKPFLLPRELRRAA